MEGQVVYILNTHVEDFGAWSKGGNTPADDTWTRKLSQWVVERMTWCLIQVKHLPLAIMMCNPTKHKKQNKYPCVVRGLQPLVLINGMCSYPE